MDTETRIGLLERLGIYLLSADENWAAVKENAVQHNAWFTLADVELAVKNIAEQFLKKDALTAWISGYKMPEHPVKVGIVMAGNIPLVGFHDFLCGFVSGHRLFLKLSTKDNVLLRHIIQVLGAWNNDVASGIHIAEMLKGCDAYIATGSNNSSRYFEQYFAKYPHIIRRNRTSVAILDGSETHEELLGLARDVFTYFGLGCRSVTQVCVPESYDFAQLLDVFDSYDVLMNHHKYHNNYDYHLAVYLLNAVPYFTNNSLLMVQNDIPFSAVSVLHYRYYNDKNLFLKNLAESPDIQSVIGHDATPFGNSQQPALSDYADGVDTMAFLCSLGNEE